MERGNYKRLEPNWSLKDITLIENSRYANLPFCLKNRKCVHEEFKNRAVER